MTANFDDLKLYFSKGRNPFGNEYRLKMELENWVATGVVAQELGEIYQSGNRWLRQVRLSWNGLIRFTSIEVETTTEKTIKSMPNLRALLEVDAVEKVTTKTFFEGALVGVSSVVAITSSDYKGDYSQNNYYYIEEAMEMVKQKRAVMVEVEPTFIEAVSKWFAHATYEGEVIVSRSEMCEHPDGVQYTVQASSEEEAYLKIINVLYS